MTIANPDNIKRIIDKYIYDNLYTEENLTIDYEGIKFGGMGSSEWIQTRIIDSRDILYFISMSFIGLYGTNLVLQRKN